jgi:hypothetical protein
LADQGSTRIFLLFDSKDTALAEFATRRPRLGFHAGDTRHLGALNKMG